ncbi:hypothetical protein CL645_03700 [bacterium]|nr:hypothetical protein [bacterium]|tara:strand:+ start:251 stop:721 length:471 start_codon:yes stop_codon:yes gene_type:complete
MINKDQVLDAQDKWAAGVVKIGLLKDSRAECESFANNFLDEKYAFELGPLLFKPTKCEEKQFRTTKSQALSYFIAGEDRECQEDKGFALEPWSNVRFENLSFILEEDRAIAMGNYFFTNLEGDEIKVEYTFGYKLINGILKIDLHHSSLPFRASSL